VKFFLDENIPSKAGEFLSRLGNDVFDIRGTGQEGLHDTEIFELAQKNHAVFITTDRDFYHTIPFLYPTHNGIIVINLSQPDTQTILSKLEWAYDFLNTNKIENCCLMITDKKAYLLKK
jgi:predicted nuclease of predicted toxin-antitoxin system